MQPDRRNQPPTAQTSEGTDNEYKDWLILARRAYQSSTDYLDSNYRKRWEDSLRAFNNQHPTDSKYNQPAYEKRSRIYRPRIRSVIRKNEAAAAAAFFSNMEVVSITAQDPTSKNECASAAVMKELLQYRLTKSVPWYQIVLGGLQDAQTTGVACAYIYWDYKEGPAVTEEETDVTPLPPSVEEDGGDDSEYPKQDPAAIPMDAMVNEDGSLQDVSKITIKQPVAVEVKAKIEPVPLMDKPCIELIPVENLRFDAAASWMDPVNTSPYFIHLMPMYVLDVKERMESGLWFKYGDDIIGNALQTSSDTTRLARNKGLDDPMQTDNQSIGDYQIVWVQRHIHRRNDEDWEFYTLSDQAMLTNPEPLKDKVFHGKRPYVIGPCLLETHKVVPSSVPELGRGLADEINEIANQRIDNVKFVLNKKYLVKRGKEADVMGLVRNVPGGVVMMDDPINDVRELSWQDVTASSFQEHQSLNQELDELLGNFNPASLMTQGAAANSPARNMSMLSNSQGTLVEYMLRTYVETFVQPVLRQLVMLEQEYETDQVVMKIAGKRAEVFLKYGINDVTDELLNNELTLTVNVGMGATDPTQKLQKFLAGMGAYSQMLMQPTPGIDMQEVGKEIFGHLGYADGSRFFNSENPQLAAAQQQLQQVQQQLQEMQKKLKDRTEATQAKLVSSREKNQTDLKRTAIQEEAANKRALATHFLALSEGSKAKQAQAQVPAPVAPKPPPPPKPADIHVHIPPHPAPQVIMHHPKKTVSRVERDASGEMVGTTMEHQYD